MVWGTLWKYLKRGLESKLNRQVRDPAPQTPVQMDRRQAGQAHGGREEGGVGTAAEEGPICPRVFKHLGERPPPTKQASLRRKSDQVRKL